MKTIKIYLLYIIFYVCASIHYPFAVLYYILDISLNKSLILRDYLRNKIRKLQREIYNENNAN